jgi:hypothetical protein
LVESTGRQFAVQPVVVFPGWYVEAAPGRQRDVWVMEPKGLPAFLACQQGCLTPEDIKLASFHLSRYVRGVERERGVKRQRRPDKRRLTRPRSSSYTPDTRGTPEIAAGTGSASSRALEHRLRTDGAGRVPPDSGCSRPPQMDGDSPCPSGEQLHMRSAEKPPVRRRVGHVTRGDPRGTNVDASDVPPAQPISVGERHSGWAMSSFELKYGLDVNDADDTVPAALFDKLFGGRGAG